MSTEANGDGKPDLVDPAGLAAADEGDPNVGDGREGASGEGYRDEGGETDEFDDASQDDTQEGDPDPGEDDEALGYADYEGYEFDEDAVPRRARRWPRVLLTLGSVVVAVAIIGGAIAIVGSFTHGFKKPVKVIYKTSAVFSLKTGDCFDPRGQQSYTLISCDSPHQAEVFATFRLTGTKWPGNTAVQATATSGCAGRLTGYVNPELAISLTSSYVYPDSIAWQAGTRTVICEVRAISGQLTGSVRGATASSA